MLPVSGAEQLNASGAIGERPMISHSGAYSRFVRPAPYSDCGSHRFQRPSACPRRLSSSTTSVGGDARRRGVNVPVHEAADTLGESGDLYARPEVHAHGPLGLQTLDLAPGE